MIDQIERMIASPLKDSLEACKPSAASQIAKELGFRLEGLLGGVSPRHFDDLKSLFDSDVSAIDYDTYADAFACQYFMKNYQKSTAALRRDKAKYHSRIADLGCGSGAMTLAYLAYLNDTLKPGPWPVKVDFVDRSSRQLDLVEEFITISRRRLPNIELDFECIQTELRDWHSTGAAPDCIFFGHVLTENRDSVTDVLQQATDEADCDAAIYVIERPGDSVWAAVRRAINALALPHQISTASAGPSLDTQYLKIVVPHRKELMVVLRTYFEAWRQQSSCLLEDVFSNAATYLEKPFSEPLVGIDQIQQYWHTKVSKQRDLNVDVIDVAYAEETVFAEWRACFKESNDIAKTVAGALTLTLADNGSGKAAALREYFRSTP